MSWIRARFPATRVDDAHQPLLGRRCNEHAVPREQLAAREAAGADAARIHVVGNVPYAEVPAWYRGASLFVFPSYLETFGHPLLEAMAADVPVLAADIAVSREVAGDAARYFDPTDVDALAREMARGVDDDALRSRLVASCRISDSRRIQAGYSATGRKIRGRPRFGGAQ